MRGTILIIPPEDEEPTMETLDTPATLEQLQKIVGGHIEEVPYFNTIAFGGIVMDCICVCDDEGKLKKKPINELATGAWKMSVARITGSDEIGDVLVGTVAVIFGDKSFMEAL